MLLRPTGSGPWWGLLASWMCLCLAAACGDDEPEEVVDAGVVAGTDSGRAGGPPPAIYLEDVTELLGVGLSRTQGVALVDYDGDGAVDVSLAAFDGLRVYRNRGDGSFEPDSERAGFLFAEVHSANGIAYGDLDSDGDLDIFLSRIADIDRVFLNDGTGVFSDVTAAWGLSGVIAESQGVSLADLDGDGDLDALVAVHRELEGGPHKPLGERGGPNLFWRNVGGGFEEAGAEVGLQGRAGGETFGSVVFDVDLDGDQDVFTVHDFRPDQLLLNDGGGMFTPAGNEWLDQAGSGLMGIDVADIDGDGRLDLFATDWGSDDVLLDLGSGAKPRFRDWMGDLLGDGVDPGATSTGWGCALADLDNDGDVDIVTTAAVSDGAGYSDPPIQRVGRNTVYENRGPGRHEGSIVDITGQAGAGLENATNGFGLAVGDIDGDRDLDVLVGVDSEFSVNAGLRPTEAIRRRVLLLRNTGAPKDHDALVLRLRQPGRLNTFAVGARVDVETADRKQSRVVTAGASYLSANSYALHFGLGTNPSAELVRVTWPDGQVEMVGPLSAGEHTIER